MQWMMKMHSRQNTMAPRVNTPLAAAAGTAIAAHTNATQMAADTATMMQSWMNDMINSSENTEKGTR